ncbi:CHASE2 domain-containing protein [Nisaea sediminum]|uniref:CHASE2 domain-containing protein n=1 Tax=Nisaea sediminum TaxID=2775867 RepID=UPI001866D0BA|nr:CHASE2 domain-containing protein [Nisaea sediminum]
MSLCVTRLLFVELLRDYRPRFPAKCPRWLDRRLIRLSLILAFGLYGLHTSFFGLGPVSSRLTYQLVNQLTSPFHDTSERESVPLVLVDDEDLDRHGWLWPISYGNHARILDEILNYGPRAVFVDFFFIDRREDPSLESLVAVLRRYAAEKVPVYVPVLKWKKQREELRNLTIGVSTRLDPSPLGELAYDLRDGHLLSPAFSLYRDACLVGDCGANADAFLALDDGFRESMQIEWGLVPSQKNEFLKGCTYSAAEQSQGDVLQAAMGKLIMFGERPDEICPYMPLISVTNLLRDGFSAEASKETAVGLEDRIVGRDVIYSQALFGVSVFVDPPVNPPVSSGYRHAMALENLRLHGNDYLRMRLDLTLPFLPEPLRSLTVDTDFVDHLAFVLLATVHAFASFAEGRFLKREDRPLRRRFVLFCTTNGFYLSVFILIAIAQVFWLRLTPANLFGLYGLIAAARGLTGSYYLKRLEDFLFRATVFPAVHPAGRQLSGETL